MLFASQDSDNSCFSWCVLRRIFAPVYVVELISLSVLIVRANTVGEDTYSNIEENNGLFSPRVSCIDVHASIAQTGDINERLIKIVSIEKIRERDMGEMLMRWRKIEITKIWLKHLLSNFVISKKDCILKTFYCVYGLRINIHIRQSLLLQRNKIYEKIGQINSCYETKNSKIYYSISISSLGWFISICICCNIE